jgi:hypothetical protein
MSFFAGCKQTSTTWLFLDFQFLSNFDGVAFQPIPFLKVADSAAVFLCDGAEGLTFSHGMRLDFWRI